MVQLDIPPLSKRNKINIYNELNTMNKIAGIGFCVGGRVEKMKLVFELTESYRKDESVPDYYNRCY